MTANRIYDLEKTYNLEKIPAGWQHPVWQLRMRPTGGSDTNTSQIEWVDLDVHRTLGMAVKAAEFHDAMQLDKR